MRYRGGLTAAALAAAALFLLASVKGRAEDAASSGIVPIYGYGPYAVPPGAPYAGVAPGWGGAPYNYGWGTYGGPQLQPPYGPPADAPPRQWGGAWWPPHYGEQSRPPPPRRPRATRPYWSGPRWPPGADPYARNYGSRANPGYGYDRRWQRPNAPRPNASRIWRGPAGPSQYGYAGQQW